MRQGSMGAWQAGAAEVDITPGRSQFLFGYPHVKRYSSGVHDPLLASALYLSDGRRDAIFVGCDVIVVTRPMVQQARLRIARLTGVAGERIMITATHTHSGPTTLAMVSNAADTTVPKPDPAFLAQLEEGIVRAAVQAFRAARPAKIGFATADGSALGTNRRDPKGPSIPEFPVVVARDAEDDAVIGVMCVVNMHPTVLHEDWTLISGDFPGLARRWLQQNVVGRRCPLVYHMGASGNQSPRHVVKSNTIGEAERLGEILGREIAGAMERGRPLEASIGVARATVDLPRRSLPAVADAESRLAATRARLEKLRADGRERALVRTAECDLFGAEETLTLAKASRSGALDEAARECMPAEVHLIRVGDVRFVGWPGEVFVEYAIRVRERHPDVHVVTLANGDLQGYLVTQAAIDEGAYEAGNAIFASPAGGDALVETTLRLLEQNTPATPAREHAACPTS